MGEGNPNKVLVRLVWLEPRASGWWVTKEVEFHMPGWICVDFFGDPKESAGRSPVARCIRDLVTTACYMRTSGPAKKDWQVASCPLVMLGFFVQFLYRVVLDKWLWRKPRRYIRFFLCHTHLYTSETNRNWCTPWILGGERRPFPLKKGGFTCET